MLDPETGDLVDLPGDLCRCWGLVMHLPVGSGECTLYDVDLTDGWHAAQLAHEARTVRARSKAMGAPYRRPRPPATTGPGERALYLIRNAGHPDALTALWRDLSARGEWTDELTKAAKARKAELVA
jgi:hypothetical protein